jgi:hypothetical protein
VAAMIGVGGSEGSDGAAGDGTRDRSSRPKLSLRFRDAILRLVFCLSGGGERERGARAAS